MSDEFGRISHRHSHPPATRREQAEPEATPDESQTQPAHDAFLGGGPGGNMASLLASADGATRARIIQRLQRERGNAYVQRMLKTAPNVAVQRQDGGGGGAAPEPGGGGAGGPASLTGAVVDITGGLVNVNAPVTRVSGVLQADTVITNTVIASTYTPGAGNVW